MNLLYGQKLYLFFLALLVLLEGDHAEECYTAEDYPIGNEYHYTENLVLDVVAAPDQRATPCYKPHPGVAATRDRTNQCVLGLQTCLLLWPVEISGHMHIVSKTG